MGGDAPGEEADEAVLEDESHADSMYTFLTTRHNSRVIR